MSSNELVPRPDRLTRLARGGLARRVLTRLGLPLPHALRRAEGPWAEGALRDRAVVVGGAGALGPALASALGAADVALALAPGADEAPFLAAASIGGAHPGPEPERVDALVFDATGLSRPQDLVALYGFFQPRLRALAPCGRVVVLGRPVAEATDAAQAAARAALDGFTRSLARELGPRGATANRLEVARGAEDRVEGPLRWLLGDHAAFVTGQPLRLGVAVPARAPLHQRPLAGRVALITGAARGIGAATAQRLAEEGAKVILLDRPEEAAPLATLARTLGGRALALDITSREAALHIAEAAGEGGLDILVHNAGVTRDRTLARMDPERWDLVLEVNLAAVARVTEALLDEGLAPGADLVLLSSVVGLSGNLGQTNYAASKAGVLGLARGLVAPMARLGGRVNAVAPGFIETRMTEAIPMATREAARRLSSLAQGGHPVDVAEAVVFLCSPGASGLSGEVLRVCGGQLIGA